MLKFQHISQGLVAAALAVALTLANAVAGPAAAADIEILRGQFAFDWHTEPAKTVCAAVDDKLMAAFKSDAFKCDLNVVTNTASEEPARICTQNNGDAEYMVFATQKACEAERETQASNE